ncbi:hypothetical protein Vretimale_11290 [Volvox reticuliferus]|uniref:Uncharacterized protein n=1 Tax=Volvox reticuliferus TaxID=1737510 RepID=A0A8J4FT45_9CHLO|nr:hypothetical protein Vretifemale_12117 [Volvox reticuliferus]GIM07144.1 hypothetical protein Vretimale_11290 [Volvox reticuliferus]
MPASGLIPMARGSAALLLPLALLTITGSLSRAEPDMTRVAVYMDSTSGVLDLQWDDGPANIILQLGQLGFEVVQATDGQPNLIGQDKPAAYIIPVQNGHMYYSSVEDMGAVAAYAQSGGLVIVLDANRGQGEALRNFVSAALGYDGRWSHCKKLHTNMLEPLGVPVLNGYASTSFLADFTDSWPAALEGSRTMSYLTWCLHEDESAFTLPLYTLQDDDSLRVAVQAFGKARNPGAVVWMGYDWKDGPQHQWGALLSKLVTDFAQGKYHAPLHGNSEIHPLSVDSVLEVATDVAAEAAEVVRRFLSSSVPGTYPPLSQEPNALPSPPPLPPGKAAESSTYTALFVCETEGFNLMQLVQRLKNATAYAYGVHPKNVIINFVVYCNGTHQRGPWRRRAIETSERMLTATEIDAVFGKADMKPLELALVRISPATDETVQQMEREEIEVLRRAMEETSAESGLLQIGYTVIRVIDVAFPPSPPPSPPLQPGQLAPPLAPPSPPSRPAFPPPSPPVDTSIIEAATGALDVKKGWSPPSPSPPLLPQAPPPQPSPHPPSPAPRSSPAVSPSPRRGPPSPFPPPSPPSPTPPPPPLFIKFKNLTGQGARGKDRSLVWNDDIDFKQQLTNLSPLQLVDLAKPNCPSTCTACPYAWKAAPRDLSVAIFFKEPMQITRVSLKQIKNSGVITVQFLKWVFPPRGVLPGNIARTVWNVSDDTSMCQSVLVVRIGPKRSGINLPVPAGGSQENLPAKLQATATGGVLITVERPPNAGLNYGPFLEWVRFSGRVLYPSSSSLYKNA